MSFCDRRNVRPTEGTGIAKSGSRHDLANKKANSMQRSNWFNIWYAIFALLAVLWLRDLYVTATQVQPIPYSEFEQQLKAGEIKDISISNNVVQGTYKNPRPDKRTRFVTTRVDPELAKELSQYDVTYSGVVESTFLRDILSFVAPALVFFAIWFFLARRMSQGGGLGGGLLSIGKSKAKVYVETDTKTTFADVAGVDEAKEELQEVVGFLKDPKGRASGRPARDRQDAARPRGGRRSRRAFLLHQRL